VADARAGANPERDLMRRQLGDRINCALEKLTPRERMVFELKHYHGLKLRTVGEILHTTEETAKKHSLPGHAEIAWIAVRHALRRSRPVSVPRTDANLGHETSS